MEKTITADLDEYQPVTPPTTPFLSPLCVDSNSVEEFIKEPKENEPAKTVPVTVSEATEDTQWFRIVLQLLFCERGAFFAAVGIMGLLLIIAHDHGKSLDNFSQDIQLLKMQFEDLEQENQMLKATLQELETRFQNNPELTANNEMNPTIKDETTFSTHFDDYPDTRVKPKTKKVWLGNEVEDRVEILDKKHNSLPDYCYFTDENDLFYEYNVEICESKRRKLESKNARDKKDNKDKKINDLNLDNIWKVESQQNYDDYITETLKSLNDEIQEIKNKRTDYNEDTTPVIVVKEEEEANATSVEVEAEKLEKPKRSEERRKKKKLQRQEQTSGEWLEKRMSGREEARKKHEKQQQEINWYLKRKNEREMNRLESLNQEL